MGQILSRWRIGIAILFSAVLVAGAYAYAILGVRPQTVQASEASALLAQIATKDSNGDGLPDWEKQLYGIPLNATTTDYFHLGMTDGEAAAKGLIVPVAVADVPQTATASATSTPIDPSLGAPPASGTLTAAFARDFFTLYMNAEQQNGGTGLSADQINSIANQALADLAASVKQAPPYKQASDLSVSGTGTAAMKTYAADAEGVLMSGTANASTTEINYLQDAITNNDASALTAIASIAKSYRVAAAGIAALPVPSELASQDLALVNALMRLGEVVQDFTLVHSDPMASMLALQEYPQAILDLGNAFIGITQAYQAAGVTFAPNQPGASFVGLIPTIAAEQAASSTTP